MTTINFNLSTTANLVDINNKECALSIRSAHDRLLAQAGVAQAQLSAVVKKYYIPLFLSCDFPMADAHSKSRSKKNPVSHSIWSLVASCLQKKKFVWRSYLDLSQTLSVAIPVVVDKMLISLLGDFNTVEFLVNQHNLPPTVSTDFIDNYILREFSHVSKHYESGLVHLFLFAFFLVNVSINSLDIATETFKVKCQDEPAESSIYAGCLQNIAKFSAVICTKVGPDKSKCLSEVFSGLSEVIRACGIVQATMNNQNKNNRSNRHDDPSLVPHQLSISLWLDFVEKTKIASNNVPETRRLFLEEILCPVDSHAVPSCSESPGVTSSSPLKNEKTVSFNQNEKSLPYLCESESEPYINCISASSNQLLTKDLLPPHVVYFPCNLCDKVRLCADKKLAGLLQKGPADDFGRCPVDIWIRQNVEGLRKHNPFIKHREHVKDCYREKMMQWVKPKGSQKQQDAHPTKTTDLDEKSDPSMNQERNENLDPNEKSYLNEKADPNKKPKVPNKVLPALYTDPRSSEHDDGASKQEREMKKKSNEKKAKEQTDVAMRLLANSEIALRAISLSLSDIPRKYHPKENNN
jgi:hypothetical protein